MKARIIKILSYLAGIATECNKEEEYHKVELMDILRLLLRGSPLAVFSFDASKFYYYDDNEKITM